jgi:hypothetical protein
MALEELGHLAVADKLTTSGLFLTFPYRRARLLVEWHGLIAPRGDRQQDFSGDMYFDVSSSRTSYAFTGVPLLTIPTVDATSGVLFSTQF